MSDSSKVSQVLESLQETLQGLIAGSTEARTEVFNKMTKATPGFLSDIRSLRTRVREILARSVESRADYLQKVAAPLGAVLSPDDLLAYLHDPNASVRQAALIIGSEHWPTDARFAEMCEKLVFSDSDLIVRELSATSLGSCFGSSCNSRISRLLAGIVSDEKSPRKLRLSAYVGLLEVQARSLVAHQPPLKDIDKFRIPEDIDWNLVNNFTA